MKRDFGVDANFKDIQIKNSSRKKQANGTDKNTLRKRPCHFANKPYLKPRQIFTQILNIVQAKFFLMLQAHQ